MYMQLGARKGKGLGAQKLNKSFTEIEQQIEQQQKEQGLAPLWYKVFKNKDAPNHLPILNCNVLYPQIHGYAYAYSICM